MSEPARQDPNWDDQRAFLAVIEAGSLSVTARRLSISRPTVRARISALEHALFVRSVNGMVPTHQAVGFADHARAMQRASKAMMRAVSSPPDTISGVVRLVVSEFVGTEAMPAMLASLREQHPDICVELVLSNTSANLLEQEVDIALRMTDPK